MTGCNVATRGTAGRRARLWLVDRQAGVHVGEAAEVGQREVEIRLLLRPADTRRTQTAFEKTCAGTILLPVCGVPIVFIRTITVLYNGVR